MAVSRMKNGRYRATIKHPITGKRVSAADVLKLGYHSSFSTEKKAQQACADALAQVRLESGTADSPTVNAWRERWLTEPRFTTKRKRPRGESTLLHYREATEAFAKKYGHLRLDQISDRLVSDWTAAGNRNNAVKVLSTMFHDAASREAGRLFTGPNPFEGLTITSRGRADLDPPTWDQMWDLIHAARRLAPPSFAAWLQLACFTGMRPGEVDALRWDDIDLDGTAAWLPRGIEDGGWIRVDEQWNVKVRKFTPPKNRKTRIVPMHAETVDALAQVKGMHPDFCFIGLWGDHWRPSSRGYHWNAVRASVGWEQDLYLATRHFAGWVMWQIMGIPAEDVGAALGHTGADPGVLVRTTYGHHNDVEALKRVKRTYADWQRPRRLTVVA